MQRLFGEMQVLPGSQYFLLDRLRQRERVALLVVAGGTELVQPVVRYTLRPVITVTGETPVEVPVLGRHTVWSVVERLGNRHGCRRVR